MQIVTKNSIATDALWTALTGLADVSVTVEQQSKDAEPYSTLHVSHDNTQHLVITGNNNGLRINRTVNTDNAVEYTLSGNNPFSQLVFSHLEIDGLESIDSGDLLSKLIEFVEFFRTPKARDFRRAVAGVETRHAEIAGVKSEFLDLLASVRNNPLEVRRFYSSQAGSSDLEQLMSTIDLAPGIYSYTPLDNGLKATHVVFVSRNNRNVLVAFLQDGLPALMSSNDAIAGLIQELGLHSGQVVKALQDESSAVYKLFDQPQQPQENEHSLDSLIAALDPGSIFRGFGSSPNRAAMFAGTRLGRALDGEDIRFKMSEGDRSPLNSLIFMAEALAAVRKATGREELPEGERRPGCFCGRCKA